MRDKSKYRISLDNPYALSLLFAMGGIIGFLIYEGMLDGICFDYFFASTFIIAMMIVISLLVHWGSKLEDVNFQIKKLPSLFLIFIALIKLLIAFQLIQSGAVDNPDSRLESYGSSILISLSGAASVLFFPIGYFASPNQLMKHVVLGTFVFTTIVGLVMGASKSAIFGLGFTVLFFIFLRRKQASVKFKYPLLSKFSAVMLGTFLILQIFLGVIIYGYSPSEFILTLVNRAMQNFDGAIYGCLVKDGVQAPNSFITYTFLPILKRLDQSYYDLDYYNVPQWLLFEVLNISREGRFGYPNDNLYTALYFGGFGYFSMILFLIISFGLHLFVKKCIATWRHTKFASPIQLGIFISVPLAFASVQEFVGLLLFLIIFKFVLFVMLLFTPSVYLYSNKSNHNC